MSRVLPYLWYPAFVAGAIAAFAGMLGAGVSPALAAYPPIVLVGVAIIVLELRFPERLAWRPQLADVKADAAYMALVQVVLPRLLAPLGILAIASWMHTHVQNAGWPQHWPLAAQIIMMVLAVDFMRDRPGRARSRP